MINNNKQNNVKESVKTSSLVSELSPRENTLVFLPASYKLSVPVRGDQKPNKPLYLTDILLFLWGGGRRAGDRM